MVGNVNPLAVTKGHPTMRQFTSRLAVLEPGDPDPGCDVCGSEDAVGRIDGAPVCRASWVESVTDTASASLTQRDIAVAMRKVHRSIYELARHHLRQCVLTEYMLIRGAHALQMVVWPANDDGTRDVSVHAVLDEDGAVAHTVTDINSIPATSPVLGGSAYDAWKDPDTAADDPARMTLLLDRILDPSTV